MASSRIDSVRRLLALGVGDQGRLEHIKQALENNKTLYTSDREYVEKLIQEYGLDQSDKDTTPQTQISSEPVETKSESSGTFCRMCGNRLSLDSNFCPKCGTGINFKPKSPKEVKITKTQSWVCKISIAMGVIGILGGFSISSGFYIFLGIILVITGFVSLKNKSKSVDQFLTIVSFIILTIVLINWFK